MLQACCGLWMVEVRPRPVGDEQSDWLGVCLPPAGTRGEALRQLKEPRQYRAATDYEGKGTMAFLLGDASPRVGIRLKVRRPVSRRQATGGS